MDPVFNPCLTFVSDHYVKAAKDQIDEMYSDDIQDLKDNYALISDVIDMKDSKAFKEGKVDEFNTDDTEIILEKGDEPAMNGSLKTACSVSDAMTLQYYEEEDALKAGFGKPLSGDQWEDIAEIKDVYGDVLFSAPLISNNVANPLLKEMLAEIRNDKRRFTFLCGHDSNIASVLSSLGAEEYTLPDAIEQKSPIGCKLVFSNWKGKDGADLWDVDLVYQTTDQLREADILTGESHPASVDVYFKGAEPNQDGLYEDKELKDIFSHAIGEYGKIKGAYQ
jgi:glucose-1-phosphatase